MLNPNKFSKRIASLNESYEDYAEELAERQATYQQRKKEYRGAVLATIFFFVLLAGMSFLALLIYPQTSPVILEKLKIDWEIFDTLAEQSTKYIVGIYVVFVLIISILFHKLLDEGYGLALAISVFVPAAVFFVFIQMSVANGFRKEAKRDFETAQKDLEAISEKVKMAKAQLRAEEKALEESNKIFEQGRTEGNQNLIQRAADMGNPSAIQFLEEQKKKAQTEQAETCYQQAHQTDPADWSLLEKAATLGHPRASLEAAEILYNKGHASDYTMKEQQKFLDKAEDYIKNTDFSDNADGKIVQIFRSLKRGEKIDYHAKLSEARKMKEAGEISPKYSAIAKEVIRRLNSEIDYMETDHTPLPNFEITDPVGFMKKVEDSIVEKYEPISYE